MLVPRQCRRDYFPATNKCNRALRRQHPGCEQMAKVVTGSKSSLILVLICAAIQTVPRGGASSVSAATLIIDGMMQVAASSATSMWTPAAAGSLPLPRALKTAKIRGMRQTLSSLPSASQVDRPRSTQDNSAQLQQRSCAVNIHAHQPRFHMCCHPRGNGSGEGCRSLQVRAFTHLTFAEQACRSWWQPHQHLRTDLNFSAS